ncbi:hypothetical protein ACQUY5_24175 [Bacillus cereus]|uniref:hypothetical protein n=1 Tax=Bacillus cereus TaxID=1396 RepID=UPI003D1782B3
MLLIIISIIALVFYMKKEKAEKGDEYSPKKTLMIFGIGVVVFTGLYFGYVAINNMQ